ncbi:MAG: hypothetical protein RI907_991 [Pseudomonadota bacterium]|jgi:hypothetical protein
MNALLEQKHGKRFDTLRAEAALSGFELLRTDPLDGQVRYIGVKWGVASEIGTCLDLVERFVRVLGGKP